MNRYITQQEASTEVMALPDAISYPNYARNVLAYPPLDSLDNPPVRPRAPKVSTLLIEAVHHLGSARRRVLDLGCSTGGNGLYLAALGHTVLAYDNDPGSVDFANNKAHELSLQRNFRAAVADVRSLTASDKYDVVIGCMLLHFFDRSEMRGVSAIMQAATLEGGLNVVSVYTADNPPGERGPGRGLKHLFAHGELAGLYPVPSWRRLRNVEGHGQPIDRSQIGKELMIVPHIAEVVARKAIGWSASGTAPSAAKSPMTYMDANRQIHYL